MRIGNEKNPSVLLRDCVARLCFSGNHVLALGGGMSKSEYDFIANILYPYSRMKPSLIHLVPPSEVEETTSKNWVIVSISFSDVSSVYGPFESYEDAGSYMINFDINGEIVFMQKDSVN